MFQTGERDAVFTHEGSEKSKWSNHLFSTPCLKKLQDFFKCIFSVAFKSQDTFLETPSG